MEYTTVEQDCYEALLSGGEKRYRIRTTAIDAGDLPQVQIFVFEIGDTADASTDSFTRIGTPYDLDTYEIDRGTAITAGNAYYLDNSFTVDFEDLDTATEAKAAILSRLDTLTNTWATYDTDFKAVEEETSHPSVSPEFEQQLKDAYKEAKEERIEDEENVEDKEEDVETQQDLLDAAIQVEQIYEDDKDFCDESKDVHWADYKGKVNTFYSGYIAASAPNNITGKSLAMIDGMIRAYNAIIVQESGAAVYPSAPDTTDPILNTILTQMRDDIQTFETYINSTFMPATSDRRTADNLQVRLDDSFSDFCTTNSANYAAAIGQKNVQQDLLASAVIAKEEAEAELAAALVAEAAALAAVLAICPDFDPDSV